MSDDPNFTLLRAVTAMEAALVATLDKKEEHGERWRQKLNEALVALKAFLGDDPRAR